MAEKPRIAVLTFSGGFKHDVLGLAEKTIGKLGEQSGAFEATLLGLHKVDGEKLDLSMIDADFLKKYDGFVFYTTSGQRDLDLLTAQQRQAFIAAIRGGKAFIGIHSATDTFYKWPEYGEMVGAYFDGHPWTADSAPVTIKVEDRDHPACRPLGASWFLQEEIYQFKEPYDRKKLHVLMSLDTAATDMTRPGINRRDGDFAVAWTRLYGKGRVFYTSLGHRADVWKDELFQQHLLGGIQWALGQKRGQPFGEPEKPGIVQLPSGLRYEDIKVGDGPVVQPWHDLFVHYTGRIDGGEEFADTRKAGQPFQFVLGRGLVIRGWEEGVPGMHVGGIRRLYVPSYMAYGEKGREQIPPNADLVFEIEVLTAHN